MSLILWASIDWIYGFTISRIAAGFALLVASVLIKAEFISAIVGIFARPVCAVNNGAMAISKLANSLLSCLKTDSQPLEGCCWVIPSYGDYSNIKLLHKLTGEVENINLDTYLYGVVAAEMPASYEIEALKAQAVVARTYTIYKVIHADKHDNADICDDSNCCQAWISKENRFARWDENECEKNWMKIVKAVDSTIR